MKVCIDGHVHIYDCFDLDDFFTAALQNFRAASGFVQDSQQELFFLLLAESKGCNWFRRFAEAGNGDQIGLNNWQISGTSEEFVLKVCRAGTDPGCMYLVAGRQVVTREKIEVLSLFSAADTRDGNTLADTIKNISEKSALAVLPWGAGKWLGSRGKVLHQLLAGGKKGFFWGDNGGRPGCWPTPDLLRSARKNGIGILSGSDPLPLAAEKNRVGSFGSIIDCDLSADSPGESLKNSLQEDFSGIIPFGGNMTTSSFLQSQLQLRLHKKHS